MKKLISIIFILFFLMVFWVSLSKSKENLEPLTLQYSWLEDSQSYSITNGTGLFLGYYTIDIPTEYNEYPITTIESSAFNNINGEDTLIIPESIVEIGGNAFTRCDDLTTIQIPASTTSIGYRAFTSCKNLNEIVVSQNNPVYHSTNNCLIHTTGKTLLLGCANSIIPDDGSVTAIADYAFDNCSASEIVIPNTITYIGSRAFGDMNIEKISISSSVTYIEYDAFEGSEFTIYAPKDSYAAKWAVEKAYKVNYIDDYNVPNSSVQPVTYDLNFKLLDNNSYIIFAAQTNITSTAYLPDKYQGLPVIAIGDNAFISCWNLQTVVLPSSIVAIGNGAFKDCINLTSITLPDSLESLGNNVFFGCSKLKEIVLPSSLKVINDYTLNGCGDGNLIIYAEENSYAAEWAISHGYVVNYIQ